MKKKKFSGTLVLVVGNSGSGKDSIISRVIKKCASGCDDIKIRTPRRSITRPSSEHENNISVSPEEFTIMETQGKFALKWQIYGFNYGIPIEIDNWLDEGNIVVVNVSRNVIDTAREIYDNIKVVFVKVPLKITIERLKKRNRERGKSLKERIERAKNHQDLAATDFVVDNSGKLEDSVNLFLDYLSTLRN
ncbi:MAG: phosphonate metabolism protein/1,5-bisphosphokinase (PRPP-forming) PhnN [Promethearchaeota archaeon]